MSFLNGGADFDQHSIIGVDFGEDYTKDFGIVPNDLTSEETMYGHDESEWGDAQQLGSGADFGMDHFGAFPKQLGIVPSGLGNYSAGTYAPGAVTQQLGYDPQQLGIVPSGLGLLPTGLGAIMDTVNKPLFKVGNFQVTVLHAGLATAAAVAAWKMGYLKKLGLNF